MVVIIIQMDMVVEVPIKVDILMVIINHYLYTFFSQYKNLLKKKAKHITSEKCQNVFREWVH
jgi:hypothetical protein